MRPPSRHHTRRLQASLSASDGLLPCAMDIRRRAQQTRHVTGAGVYVLMDDAGAVYVLKAASTISERMVEQHWEWFVGHYHCTPDIMEVFDDLQGRAREVGMLTGAGR